MDSDSAYQPNVWDKEANYREFERVHGFDIRGELNLGHSRVPDLRDTRDPESIGQTLMSTRPFTMSICEFADLIERARG